MDGVVRTLIEKWWRTSGFELVYEGRVRGPVVRDVVFEYPGGWGSPGEKSIVVRDRVSGVEGRVPYTSGAV